MPCPLLLILAPLVASQLKFSSPGGDSSTRELTPDIKPDTKLFGLTTGNQVCTLTYLSCSSYFCFSCA